MHFAYVGREGLWLGQHTDLVTARRLETQELHSPFPGLQEVQHLISLVQNDIDPQKLVRQTIFDLPVLSRAALLSWSDKILSPTP